MYANRRFYTDIDPYEVIKVESEKVIYVREMNAELTNRKEMNEHCNIGGFCCHFDNSLQRWNITPNENAPVLKLRKHKDGFFHLPNDKTTFKLSEKPIKHYDFNF